jgi:hypothetical protein
MVSAGLFAGNQAYANTLKPLPSSPYIAITGTWDADQAAPYRPHFPAPDVRNILTADTLLGWLNREDTLHTWTFDDSGFAGTDLQDELSSWRFICLLSPQAFALLKGGVPVALTNAAPVWPGLSAVTLGTPVDLADTVTVEGPMDGVIVSLTSVPTTRGHYVYGDLTAWLNIGALTFVDDNGQAEVHQPLNFTGQVYCPKSMVHAGSCKLRVGAGVVGTVTPWSVTA